MEYVRLGNTGLKVSRICLGTMTFGEDWGWGSTVAESDAILAAYLDRGGNFIDTADAYTGGASERIVGREVPWARHPQVNESTFVPEWVYGNMAPQSPPERARARPSRCARRRPASRPASHARPAPARAAGRRPRRRRRRGRELAAPSHRGRPGCRRRRSA